MIFWKNFLPSNHPPAPLFLFNNFITHNPCISNGFVIYIVYDIICYCGYSVYGYNDTQRQKRLFRLLWK